ncbi:hypothetical protein B0H14DRAFT_2573756 [Mycena olivaceomarginata]|nr:hypothetical protein B0H14DRAFT_2573756 [Mycena olivaceomarginata]
MPRTKGPARKTTSFPDKLSEEEKALCRVWFAQIATFMDAEEPKTYDAICRAMSWLWPPRKDARGNFERRNFSQWALAFDKSDSLAQCIAESSPQTINADREIALGWVQKSKEKAGLFKLLGLHRRTVTPSQRQATRNRKGRKPYDVSDWRNLKLKPADNLETNVPDI